MTVSRRRSVRPSIGRLAVAGAATLATVIASAPMAGANEDPVANEDTGSTESPADDATGETPVDETSAGSDGPAADESAQEAAPTSKAAAADKGATAAADEAEVEPNFGLQKFRVGVRIADGTTVPDGTSTAGSTITITITNSEDEDTDVVCETDESTVDEEGDDPTASFCLLSDLEVSDEDLLSPPAFAEDAIERATTSADDEIQEDQYFYGDEGETYTITQTAAVDGLEIDPDVVVIEPCEAANGPFCAPGEGQADGIALATKVVFEDTAPVEEPEVEEVDDSEVADDDALLPDTGGSDAALLGYATLMMAGGGWLVARGRRRATGVSID